MAISKTAAGQEVLKNRSTRLTPRQRAALILIDGQRSLEDVLGAGGGVTPADIERLLALGLVADEPGDSYPVPLLDAAAPPAAERERYRAAYAVATRLTGSLAGRSGRLTLAVEAAGSLDELRMLAPRIRQQVAPEAYAELARLLGEA